MAFPPESAGDRVRFGNDGFLGVHVRVLIDTMLKGIIAATFSEASSKLKVLSKVKTPCACAHALTRNDGKAAPEGAVFSHVPILDFEYCI